MPHTHTSIHTHTHTKGLAAGRHLTECKPHLEEHKAEAAAALRVAVQHHLGAVRAKVGKHCATMMIGSGDRLG